MVYPAPSWGERVYRWTLTKDPNVSAAIAIAVICSVLLVTMAVTVVVKRAESDIRMLQVGW